MGHKHWRFLLIALAMLLLAGCDEWLAEDEGETAVGSGESSAAPPVVSNTVVNLDDVRLEKINVTKSGQAIVEIEEGDVSFLFVAIADDKDDQLYATQIVAPDGETLYELFDFYDDEFRSEMFTEAIYEDGELMIYLPVAPQFGELLPGEYEIWLDSIYGEGVDEAWVVIRSGPVTGWQAVDINLFVVSDDDAVADKDNWQELETEVRTAVNGVLNQQQMQMGQLNIVWASKKIIKKYAELDDENMEKICEEMADEVGLQRAWNIVLVDELLDEDNDPYYGLSPYLGSTLIQTNSTCVIVAWEIHDNNIEELAATIVHEGSHFVGLQHTTEEDGLVFDIFRDTPQCPLDRYDQDGDDWIDDEECGAGGGAANYMFPTTTDLEELIMSDDQGWVLRRHPTFYPAEK